MLLHTVTKLYLLKIFFSQRLSCQLAHLQPANFSASVYSICSSKYKLNIHFQHFPCLHQWNHLLKRLRSFRSQRLSLPGSRETLEYLLKVLFPSEICIHRCGAQSKHGEKSGLHLCFQQNALVKSGRRKQNHARLGPGSF